MGQCYESDSSKCSCSNSNECTFHAIYEDDSEFYTSSCGEEEGERPKFTKEKVLMASTEEEVELRILSQIRAMEEGDMKNRPIEAFTDPVKTKASNESGKKPLFIDASYERKTKSFQMHHQKLGRVRSLTLGEVSGEIHHLKAEISAIKAQIAEIQKGKRYAEEKSEEEDSWNPTAYHQEVQVAEGMQDLHFGFKDMRLFTITYQQHHVKVNICIQGKKFQMIALLDFGVDINILNIKNVPAKYWVSVEREVVGLRKLQYEIPRASLCFDTHCVYMKFAIADIPIDCILGNVFLAVVEPHGSARLKGGRAGYFISVPTSKGKRKKIELPYVSSPRISTMVQAMQKLNKAESLLSDLKDLKCTLRFEEQLKLPQTKGKI